MKELKEDTFCLVMFILFGVTLPIVVLTITAYYFISKLNLLHC